MTVKQDKKDARDAQDAQDEQDASDAQKSKKLAGGDTVEQLVEPLPVIAVEEKPRVDYFCVFQGKQPVHSNEDVNVCHAVANSLKASAVLRGIDISVPEHRIFVQAMQ